MLSKQIETWPGERARELTELDARNASTKAVHSGRWCTDQPCDGHCDGKRLESCRRHTCVAASERLRGEHCHPRVAHSDEF